MSVNEKMTAIADAIRAKTGGTTSLTLDGMAQAIAGIRAEGGGGLAYDMGEFVLDSDTQTAEKNAGIPHGLGSTPDFILVWTDEFNDVTPDNLPGYSTVTSLGYVYLAKLFGGVNQRLTSSATSLWPVYAGFSLGGDTGLMGVAVPTSVAYGIDDRFRPSAESFCLPRPANNVFWRAGVIYKYFVSEAWWEGGAANAE